MKKVKLIVLQKSETGAGKNLLELSSAQKIIKLLQKEGSVKQSGHASRVGYMSLYDKLQEAPHWRKMHT
jgi:hypothetical protein